MLTPWEMYWTRIELEDKTGMYGYAMNRLLSIAIEILALEVALETL